MANLYILATPIGNLGDFSLRGLAVLKEVDLILAEDTRTTKKLLAHYQIDKAIISYHQHSRLAKVKYILEQLKQGQKIALVSEAGTPGINDPGAKLIDYLVSQLPDLNVIPIPGPSALITALSISGLSADKFIFLGFPPAKKKRKKFFEEVAQAKHTVVFYESPHRILKSLNELAVVLSASEESRKRRLIEQIKNPPTGGKIKGEFVVVVGRK